MWQERSKPWKDVIKGGRMKKGVNMCGRLEKSSGKMWFIVERRRTVVERSGWMWKTG